LPGQEDFEVLSEYTINNALLGITRTVVSCGITNDEAGIQRDTIVAFALKVLRRREDRILVHHWRCRLPGDRKAATDLTVCIGYEPTFFLDRDGKSGTPPERDPK
jgi:hypothetical protein